MSEFLLAEQLTAKLNLTDSDLPQFEAQGIIKPVTKNGHTYYSSRDFYRLKGVLFFMRDKGLTLDEAQNRLADWNWFAQSAGAPAAAR
jgi:DNA-binding transcriptional MerR regulator